MCGDYYLWIIMFTVCKLALMQERWFNKVKRMLKKKHITMEVVGKHLGVDKSAISQRLSGKTGMEVEELMVIAGLLGSSLDELCKDDPQYPKNITEFEIIEAWREVSPERQAVIVDMIKSMAK